MVELKPSTTLPHARLISRTNCELDVQLFVLTAAVILFILKPSISGSRQASGPIATFHNPNNCFQAKMLQNQREPQPNHGILWVTACLANARNIDSVLIQ